MMRRLVDEQAPGTAAARAAALLAAMPHGDPPEGAKQRVRRALHTRPAGRAWAPRLAPILVATLLFLSLTAVAATVGRGVITRWLHGSPPPPAPAVTPAPVVAPAPPPAAPVAEPAPVAVAPAPAAVEAAPAAPRRPAPAARSATQPPEAPVPAQAASQPAAAAAVSAPASQPAAAPLPPDAALVLGAMRALRHQRDPAAAGRLLDRYLALHPDGPLAEEALGLAIEAAATRKDPAAATYANGYLRRFPDGRFAEAARRARARFGGAAAR
jgi:hypothetical protein